MGGFGDDGWDDEAEFSHLIDRLGARFGLHRVVRLVAQDTHIPEFAVMALPAHAVSAGNYITQAISSGLPSSSGYRHGAAAPSPRLRGEGRGEGRPEARRAKLNSHAKPRPGPAPVALARADP